MRLGIDPGITGAFALISGCDVISCWDMPTYEYTVKAKDRKTNKQIDRKRRSIDPFKVYQIIRQSIAIADGNEDVLHVILERQQHNMGKGVDSPMTAFTVGRNYGKLESAIEIAAIEYMVVHPNSWKTKANLKNAEKHESIDHCLDNFNTQNFISLKKHIGRAESILIAYYGL